MICIYFCYNSTTVEPVYRWTPSGPLLAPAYDRASPKTGPLDQKSFLKGHINIGQH